MGNEQGSIEWRKERLSRITASRFGDAMGSVAARASYARQLRAEMELLKRINAGEQVEPQPDFYSAATAWGKKCEPIARAEYEWRHETVVTVPGFRVHPEYPFIGCSIDGVAKPIGCEFKCPFSQEVHAYTLAHGIPHEHIPQIQGEAWIYGFDAIDFVSFDPRRTGADQWFEKRVVIDRKYVQMMERKLVEFWEFVMSGKDYPEDKAEKSVPILF